MKTEILTLGYGGKLPHRFLDELDALQPDLVVDVRRDAEHAFLGFYTSWSLRKRIRNYVWIPELGNAKNTLEPPITLVNEENGMSKLLSLIRNRQARRVVFLCAEADEDGCHRKYVKELAQKMLRAIPGM